MARLTGGLVGHSRIDSALEAAARWNKTVVLKGAHTVVAHPDGSARLSPFANPALATAGTGDVLAGAIVGLLAQARNAGRRGSARRVPARARGREGVAEN